MSKIPIPLPIGFDVKGEVEARSIKSSLRGSPTTTVRQHVIHALAYGTGLSRIDRIVLVDSAGAERDSTTSLNYSISTGTNQATLTITCIISITANYTITRVRAYSGTNLYFDTSLATPITVNVGDSVSVTLTITITFSGTLTYGNISIPGDATHPTHTLTHRIAQVLSGAVSASSIRISAIFLRLWEINLREERTITITPSISVAADGLSLTISGSWTSDSDYEILYIAIRIADGSNAWGYNVNGAIGLPAGSRFTYTETVSA
jgi:hypothetical protein